MALPAPAGTSPASTRDRLVAAALASFAARGFEATSLDDVAAEVGVAKQTLLYHHPSKEALLGAVIEQGVRDLADFLRAADRAGRPGPAGSSRDRRVERLVDALFRIGVARPELLEIVREALRLGPPASTRLLDEVEPFVAELAGAVPREAVLTVAAMVVGMATEADVLRGLGVAPTRADLRRRRRTVLDYLSSRLG